MPGGIPHPELHEAWGKSVVQRQWERENAREAFCEAVEYRW